jgi:flagellar basal-body rod modification protein FlgD
MATTINPLSQTSTYGTSSVASTAAANDAGSADRFLKLLVAQMKNQDPLNPMDNAEVTSQMAQINTVTGIAKLNTTIEGLSSQFVQMQALQGASLVGRYVTVKGSALTIAEGKGYGGFELASPADSVKVEILSAAGQVIGTQNLGAAGSGVHSFDWNAAGIDASAGTRFRVTATSGAKAVDVTPLMLDRVASVNAGGTTLTLDLAQSGTVDYSAVKAFN